MPRVTVYHLAPAAALPLIEGEGLRTRADLSARYGPIGAEDETAPGQFAHGRRVSAYLSLDHARAQVEAHGPGLVSFSVDPAKAVAAPASARTDDAVAYWAATRSLAEWLADGHPAVDLEVHQNVPVRGKHVRLHTPLVSDEQLGDYAPLVAAVADDDRLAAKALMHLAVIAAEGDPQSPAFNAAIALAWRDEPDPPSLARELFQYDPDKVASTALAEYGAKAPAAVERLREVQAEVRTWADENDSKPGQALFTRMAAELERAVTPPVTPPIDGA